MEDSEKRKQLLKAMRIEAAATAQNDGGSTEHEASMNTGHLSNPLAETPTHQQESYETPRFDYYTDPMSAYSSFKRNKTPKQQYISSPSYQVSSPAPRFPPPVPGSLSGSDYQTHANYGGFQAAHYDGDNLHTGPRGMAPPQGGSPTSWNNYFRPPPVNHLGQAQWLPRPFPFSQESPDVRNNSFGSSYNNTVPQFSNYGRQNSNWVGNTYPSSGRGRSRGRGRNASFGRDGGRKPMELGADRFYSNSMTEDPWKHLTPVLWKSCSDYFSSNSTGQARLQNSMASKKPILLETSRKPSNNQQSLAEYLAASLDEATCNESSN